MATGNSVFKHKKSGKRCVVVVGGCNKTALDGVSLHQFPSEESVKKKWLKFVQTTRADFLQPAGCVCSDHFADELIIGKLEKQLNLRHSVNLSLNATPTIKPTPSNMTTKSSRVSRASSKLQVARVCINFHLLFPAAEIIQTSLHESYGRLPSTTIFSVKAATELGC